MSEPSPTPSLPADLRWLKWLVMALTGVMILGVIVIAGALVLKLRAAPPVERPLALPAGITLPQGQSPRAVTLGEGWIGVLTEKDKFFVYSQADGSLQGSFAIDQASN